MELIRKNIHMDRIKCKADTQLTLEDDRNVPDQNPDMEKILVKKGVVKADEIKPAADHVNVKGKLEVSILYAAEDETASRMDIQLPFEERIYMEGAEASDNVELEAKLEDLTIDRINSRKLSIRALLSLSLCVEELYDEELAVELYHEDEIEVRKKPQTITELAILKKDILRFKEEMEMPQSYPNIFALIWEEAQIAEIDFEALEGEISAQGEIRVFLLYEGEGEERALKCYEKTIPFRETIECQGCRDSMIPAISWRVSHKEVEVRPDFDGEERVACLELVVDLDIRLYEEEQIDVIADAYGVSKEVKTEKKAGNFILPLLRFSGKTKLTEQMKLPASLPDMSEICHSSAEAAVESADLRSETVELTGTLTVEAIYLAKGENRIDSFSLELPFVYELDTPGLDDLCELQVKAAPEQLGVSMLGCREADIRAVVAFHLSGVCRSEEETVSNISVSEPDLDTIKELPGIVAYFAKDGDDLWELGKRYYVPLERIREINHLSGERLKAGDKILIVR